MEAWASCFFSVVDVLNRPHFSEAYDVLVVQNSEMRHDFVCQRFFHDVGSAKTQDS